MTVVQDDHVIQTFTPNTPNEPLHVGVLPRTPGSDQDLETITKWGLRSFPVLVQTCLHPGVPATKCRAQIIV
jgi:hypothetical protein